MGASGVSLREITDQNREAVVALRIAPSQEGYVSTVSDSLEEARDTPEGNPWYRAIYADDQPPYSGHIRQRDSDEPRRVS